MSSWKFSKSMFFRFPMKTKPGIFSVQWQKQARSAKACKKQKKTIFKKKFFQVGVSNASKCLEFPRKGKTKDFFSASQFMGEKKEDCKSHIFTKRDDFEAFIENSKKPIPENARIVQLKEDSELRKEKRQI